MPSAVKRPLAFQVANESVGASLGRMRLVASLWGLTGLGQVSGSQLGVASDWLPLASWFELGPRVKVAVGGQASDCGRETGGEPGVKA